MNKANTPMNKPIDRSSDISQPVDDLHENEQLKSRSHYLRGTIASGLQDRLSGALAADDTLLTKFHGIYQQDNRDIRQNRLARKLEPDYQFMVRLRLPGGVLSRAQWLEIDRLSRRYASSGIRITTRQTIQLHGVYKHHLRTLLNSLRHVHIDTIAACGDDTRGIVCGANPSVRGVESAVFQLAQQTSDQLIPQTTAYPEIWYGDSNALTSTEEPLYGPLYLPRKFKIGFVIPPVNDVDIYAQDVGFIAIIEAGHLTGFNLCVGGGMGQLDTRDDSYPRLASVIGFIPSEMATQVAQTILTIQRDYGDRKDRHRARFKYTIDRLGIDTFKSLLEQRLDSKLAAAREFNFTHNGDPLGWQQTNTQEWRVTLHIPSGRVNHALQDQLQALFQFYDGKIRLTTNQNLQLFQIPEYARQDMEQRLADIGLTPLTRPQLQTAHTLSCVSLPTCGLAMAEAERYAPVLIDKINRLKSEYQLDNVPINIRLTGCPNGCARPYLGEIALTGRAEGIYHLYLGGSPRGDRLAVLHQPNVNEPTILDTLAVLFKRFSAERLTNESFGDFLVRSKIVPSPVERPINRSQS